MTYLTLWWVWMAAALGLAILETLLTGFIFLGFAIGAFGVSLILVTGLVSPSLALLALVFAGLSLIAWLLLRHFFAIPKGQVKTFTKDIND
ncbi:MAG: hypothetical protein L3J36_06585 [Rhodobacteraceae bacterium]|nr:hypothetical protein [Paracoccaceae bacterium]